MDDAIQTGVLGADLRGKRFDLLRELDIADVDRLVSQEFLEGFLAFFGTNAVEDSGALFF